MAYPLDGIRVLDFSRVLAGPYATRLLSDLGADVLKIEGPEGDLTRRYGKVTGGQSGLYIQQNIGKRNVCLDLKADGAKELIHRLVAVSDMVVENFRPGVMDRLGFGWETLHAINPKLVMLSISGYGQVGPERDRASYAPMMHAETGMLVRQGKINGQPLAEMSLSLADTFSSLHGVIGVLAALRVAEQTGQGQQVDMAMINAMHGTDDHAHFALDGVWSVESHGGFWELWEAPEGAQIGIAGTPQVMWKLLSTHDNLEDPTPPGATLDVKIGLRRQAINQHLAAYESFNALTDRLDAFGLAWGKIRQPGEDAFAEPSVEGRGVFVEVDDGQGTKRRTVQSPYRFSDAQSGITPDSHLSRHGEDNSKALQDWLGMETADLDTLIKAGVIQDPPHGEKS